MKGMWQSKRSLKRQRDYLANKLKEMAELRHDRKRLDWVEAQCKLRETWMVTHLAGELSYPENLRAAIDAAMRHEKEGK